MQCIKEHGHSDVSPELMLTFLRPDNELSRPQLLLLTVHSLKFQWRLESSLLTALDIDKYSNYNAVSIFIYALIGVRVVVTARTILRHSLALYVVCRELDLNGTRGNWADRVIECAIVCD